MDFSKSLALTIIPEDSYLVSVPHTRSQGSNLCKVNQYKYKEFVGDDGRVGRVAEFGRRYHFSAYFVVMFVLHQKDIIIDTFTNLTKGKKGERVNGSSQKQV